MRYSHVDNVGDFERDGYTIVRSLIDLQTIERLREIWDESAVKSGSSTRILGNELLYTFPGLIFPIVASHEALTFLEAIMGPFVQLDSVALVGTEAGDESGISWHRDPYAGMPRGTAFQRPLAVHLLVYLQDMTDETGPLRIIKQSHRRPISIEPSVRRGQHANEDLITPRSGDAVLFHNSLLHSRSQNRSQFSRVHFSAIYNLTCMKTTIDPRQSSIVSLLKRLDEVGDPRLERLLGKDVHADERYNSGFLLPDKESWALWQAEEVAR